MTKKRENNDWHPSERIVELSADQKDVEFEQDIDDAECGFEVIYNPDGANEEDFKKKSKKPVKVKKTGKKLADLDLGVLGNYEIQFRLCWLGKVLISSRNIWFRRLTVMSSIYDISTDIIQLAFEDNPIPVLFLFVFTCILNAIILVFEIWNWNVECTEKPFTKRKIAMPLMTFMSLFITDTMETFISVYMLVHCNINFIFMSKFVKNLVKIPFEFIISYVEIFSIIKQMYSDQPSKIKNYSITTIVLCLVTMAIGIIVPLIATQNIKGEECTAFAD